MTYVTKRQNDRRVFVASVATETNTFSPLRTDLQDFKDSFYAPAGEHPETPTLCSGVFPAARRAAEKYHWQLMEGTASWAEPGGMVNGETWKFLKNQLLAELSAAMPVNIVLLGLHGAMVAQNCQDCEGELLAAVREIVGDEVIIAATLDPHSHQSQKRTENADLLIAFKEFPHTDFAEVAEDLCQLAERVAAGEVAPVMSVFDCKMIEVLPTSIEPMRSFVDKIKRYEKQGEILSGSIIHGFMAGDVADLGTKVIVITDGDAKKGAELAREWGMELFSYRGITRPEFITAQQAIEVAKTRDINSQQVKPLVIADVWDNPGGGVPGDSTIMLREAISQELTAVVFGTIWDPIAVRTCFSAGEGAIIRLRFGGKMSDQTGDPVDADVTILKLVRSAQQSFGNSIVPLGDSVWLEFEGIHVILNTVRSQVFSPDLFSNMGITLSDFMTVVLKSTNHFYDAFLPVASEILYAAVDGPYPSDPQTNDYKNLTRKIWPRIENPHQ